MSSFLSQQQMFPPSRMWSGTFCSEENVPQCMSYISQELGSLGLSLWPGEVSKTSVSLNVVAALNVMFELLQIQRRTMENLKELQEEHMRRSHTLDNVQLNNCRLKEQLEVSLREKAGLHETKRQLQLKIKTLQSCLKSEKGEVLKLQSIMSSRSSQFLHESKRKEREAAKLKERLNQLLLQERRERQPSMEVLNCLSRSDGKRSRWKTLEASNSRELEMFRRLLGEKEEAQQSVTAQNAELRSVLQQMKEEMMLLLRSKPGDAEEISREGDSEGEGDPVGLGQEAVDGSCDQAREQLTHSIRLQWRRIRDHVEKLDHHACDLREEEMETMRREVHQCRDFIHTQQLLLQGCGCDQDTAMLLSDGYSLEEKERLRGEWMMFEQQKRNFEGERRSFTEAAIRLGREKKAFEEERAFWMKKHFLSMTASSEGRRQRTLVQDLLHLSLSGFLSFP